MEVNACIRYLICLRIPSRTSRIWVSELDLDWTWWSAHRHITATAPPPLLRFRCTCVPQDNGKCQIGVPRSECEGFSHEGLQIRLHDGRSIGFSSVITPLLNVMSEENKQDKQILFRSDAQT